MEDILNLIENLDQAFLAFTQAANQTEMILSTICAFIPIWNLFSLLLTNFVFLLNWVF